MDLARAPDVSSVNTPLVVCFIDAFGPEGFDTGIQGAGGGVGLDDFVHLLFEGGKGGVLLVDVHGKQPVEELVGGGPVGVEGADFVGELQAGLGFELIELEAGDLIQVQLFEKAAQVLASEEWPISRI